jgi:hypothetical protein
MLECEKSPAFRKKGEECGTDLFRCQLLDEAMKLFLQDLLPLLCIHKKEEHHKIKSVHC